MHAKLLRVLGPRPRQRMRRAGWQSDSDSVATSRDRGPACDRSEGRSEEDGSDRNVVEDCRGGSSEQSSPCPRRRRAVVPAPSSPQGSCHQCQGEQGCGLGMEDMTGELRLIVLRKDCFAGCNDDDATTTQLATTCKVPSQVAGEDRGGEG